MVTYIYIWRGHHPTPEATYRSVGTLKFPCTALKHEENIVAYSPKIAPK